VQEESNWRHALWSTAAHLIPPQNCPLILKWYTRGVTMFCNVAIAGQ